MQFVADSDIFSQDCNNNIMNEICNLVKLVNNKAINLIVIIIYAFIFSNYSPTATRVSQHYCGIKCRL